MSNFAKYSIDQIFDDLKDENSKRAHLIAAAPDMLEALVRAERKLSAYVGVCSGDKELTETVLPMARAAIDKAEGR